MCFGISTAERLSPALNRSAAPGLLSLRLSIYTELNILKRDGRRRRRPFWGCDQGICRHRLGTAAQPQNNVSGGQGQPCRYGTGFDNGE